MPDLPPLDCPEPSACPQCPWYCGQCPPNACPPALSNGPPVAPVCGQEAASLLQQGVSDGSLASDMRHVQVSILGEDKRPPLVSGLQGRHEATAGPRGLPSQSDGVVAEFLRRTSLVSEETSVDDGPYTLPAELSFHSEWQRWKHKSWSGIRSRIWKAFHRTGQSPSRMKSFDLCCSSAVLQQRDTGGSGLPAFRFKGSRCRDRLCTPCAHLRSLDIQSALYEKLKSQGAPLLITLTLRSDPTEDLAPLLVRLRTSFKYLRSHPVWNAAVRGGAAFLEITRGEKNNRWHVHYHIVADGDYLKQSDLSRAWYGITKDSFKVWLERAKDARGVAYSTKYAAKGIDFDVIKSEPHLDECINAFHGSRLVTTFGTWYNSPFSTLIDSELLDEGEEVCSGWSTLCDVRDLLTGSVRIDPEMAAFLNSHGFIREILRPPNS